MNMLDVRSLYVTYLSEEERVEAVRGIDFSAEEGKVTGIVGESGSGKSTAMLAVMGLLDHKAAVEAEKVSLFGNTVRAGDNAAIIFQDPLKCLNPTVKIGRQIAETVRNRKKCTWREAKKRSEELLDSVGIRHPRLRMKQYPFELSGGMRQRLGIAQAILNDPKILILDEPTAGLDPGERIRFRNIISNIAKNRMVLISTHIVSDIEYIANQVVILQEGKLNRMGTVEGLCNDIQGSVWKVNVDEMTAEELMKNYLTSNIKRVDENVLMRIISKNKPIKNARMSEPQLEDVFLTVFCEQAGI